MPVAHVTVLLAGPGAIFDRLLLRSCTCGYAHVFHVPAGAWRRELVVRTPRCHPRRPHRIEVVDVLPAAAVAGQRRRAGAA